MKLKKIVATTTFVTCGLFCLNANALEYTYNGGLTQQNFSFTPSSSIVTLDSALSAGGYSIRFNSASPISIGNTLLILSSGGSDIQTFNNFPVSVGAYTLQFNATSQFDGFRFKHNDNNSILTFTFLRVCDTNANGGCAGGLSGGTSSTVNLAPNAYALRSVYNIQSAALNAGLSYDCNMFDKQGFCLSTGGRYSTTNSPETNTTSGLLIGSYKYDKHIRLGAWVDQNLSTNNTTGMTLSNSNPLFGVFGAWAERNDGLGYEVKVSAGYGDKDVTVTRTSTNQGSTQLRMRGISTVSSFGFAIDGGLIAAPYVGVKYTSINRGAYTEGGSGALTYDNLRQESTTAVAGVRLSGKIDNQIGFVVSAGAEHDLNHNVGQYSAGSSNTTAFNSNVQKTRPVVTAGVFYDIDKTQRIGVNAIHRQEPFQSTTSTTGLVTYTVGF